MAKFARVLDFRGNDGEAFDQIFSDHGGMQSRAAAGKNNASDVAQLRGRHVQAAQFSGAFFQTEPAAHCIAHRVRLLKDFLEHVMGVIAFLNILGSEFELADLMSTTCSGQ